MKKVESYVFTLIILLASVISMASAAPRIDDKQVRIMIWPELETNSRFQFDFESSYVKERVYSNRLNSEVIVREQPTYAISYGTSYSDRIHWGVQFGPTRFIFLNLSLNFNFQYDLYRADNLIVALISMYGGVLFPGERYGGKLLISYISNEEVYYVSYEKMRSYRYFQSGRDDDGKFYFDNTVEYNLIGHTTSLGLRTESIGRILGNKNLKLDLNLGYEEDDSVSYYNASYEPADFKREAGIIVGVSFVLLY